MRPAAKPRSSSLGYRLVELKPGLADQFPPLLLVIGDQRLEGFRTHRQPSRAVLREELLHACRRNGASNGFIPAFDKCLAYPPALPSRSSQCPARQETRLRRAWLW